MRYTTVIDISEFPMLYRNVNVRLLYFHLCLKAGYHDFDRDICDISVRRLAQEVGITYSATRHALRILEEQRFITYNGNAIMVRKWLQDETITKRSRSKKEQILRDGLADERRRSEILQQERDENRTKLRELTAKGLTSFIVFYENKYDAWQHGDGTALTSLKRNLNEYLAQCTQVNHKPVLTEI